MGGDAFKVFVLTYFLYKICRKHWDINHVWEKLWEKKQKKNIVSDLKDENKGSI